MVEEEHPENDGSADQENGMQSPVVHGSSSRTRTAASVFRSLSSHHSSGSTDEALAAMENTVLEPEPPPIQSSRMESDDDESETEAGAERTTTSGRVDRQLQLFTDWRSLYVCTLLSFCTSVQFSLYFSSMWQYFQVLDSDADEPFFGYIVAIYSLGQIIGSPLVGYISNKLRKIRHMLYFGLLLMFLGNTLYLTAHLFVKTNRRYLLLLARFVTGIGSSNISLLKAYASTASTQTDRSRAIALVTGGVALGMTMGPAFQLLFTPLGNPGPVLIPEKLNLSMYTAPALLACTMNLLNALCIFLLFRENYAGLVNSKIDGVQEITLPKPDRKAVFLCHGTRFTQMFINTNLETLGAPFAMMIFAWDHNESVKYFSIAHGAMSLLAFLTYIAFIFIRIDKIMDFRTNLMISLFALILFHALTFSYPFLPGHIHTYYNDDKAPPNGTEVGCNTAKYTWCATVRPMSPYYFYFCYIFFIGLAFPNINVTLNTLFSKIIGPRRQGTHQGVLQMSGGMARMIGPIVISHLYFSFGPQSAWLAEIAMTALTLALWFLLFKKMVPLEVPHTLIPQGQEVHKEAEKMSVSPRRKLTQKKSAEEGKCLMEHPSEEEPELEGEYGEEQEKPPRNNGTISTISTAVADLDEV